MKYKLLLTGNNKTVIGEFFTQMDFSFECLSTSERYDDILNHVKYFHPDAFVYCLFRENSEDLKKFINVESVVIRKKFPIVVIGSPEECDLFARVAPAMEVTMMHRPMTTRNMENAISKLLDERREKIEMEEREQKEKEREAQERDAQEKEAREKAKREQELLEAAAAAIAAGTMPEEEKRRRHVLIVDDDSSVLKLIKGYLTEKYDVATAISGKVAMKFLETRRTDLVLLDYEMPVENGPAVLGKIRSDAHTKNLPVVFLTGVTDKEKIQEVLAMKPQGYLLKPIEAERLYATIDSIFSRKE